MQYRRLGKSGLQLSAFSLGSWVTFGKQVHLDDAKAMIKTAFDLGINFFDNAEAYEAGKSEIVMGEALESLGLPRAEYCVSSKVFWGGEKPNLRGLSSKHVTEACHAALKRLRVDYLDLYFCHRPDLNTPIEETVRAMHNLIVQGKILYWGTSEWNAQQIMEAHRIAERHNLTPPTMEQPQYNLFERDKVENDYRDIYESVGLGTTVWSPLASGILTGKYNNGIGQEGRLSLPGYEWLREIFESEEGKAKIEKVKQLSVVADNLGVPVHHLALAWCLKNPNVSTVILGASKTEQLLDNVKALEVLEKLSADVVEAIEAIVKNKPLEPKDWAAL